MTATAAQILQLRRMTNEPTATTYSDALLTTFIETYPLLDERGEDPYTWDTSTTPPSQDANEDWIATYDLHAAAADIWEEKAAVVAADFNFAADGQRFDRAQIVDQYMKQARYHRGHRSARTITLHKSPKEDGAYRQTWVGNLPEPNDDW